MSYGVEIRGNRGFSRQVILKIHVGAFRYPLENHTNLKLIKRHFCTWAVLWVALWDTDMRIWLEPMSSQGRHPPPRLHLWTLSNRWRRNSLLNPGLQRTGSATDKSFVSSYKISYALDNIFNYLSSWPPQMPTNLTLKLWDIFKL